MVAAVGLAALAAGCATRAVAPPTPCWPAPFTDPFQYCAAVVHRRRARQPLCGPRGPCRDRRRPAPRVRRARRRAARDVHARHLVALHGGQGVRVQRRREPPVRCEGRPEPDAGRADRAVLPAAPGLRRGPDGRHRAGARCTSGSVGAARRSPCGSSRRRTRAATCRTSGTSSHRRGRGASAGGRAVDRAAAWRATTSAADRRVDRALDRVDALREAELRRVERERGVLGRLVGGRDAGELRDLARARLPVEAPGSRDSQVSSGAST